MVDHVHAREQLVEVVRDDLLEEEPLAVGHDDEPGQQRRHLDPGEAALVGGRVDDAQVERQAGDAGEGGRVDRQRCPAPGRSGCGARRWPTRGRRRRARSRSRKTMPSSARLRQIGPGKISSAWATSSALRRLIASGCSGTGHPVGTAAGDAGRHPVAESGGADLEELIQVLAEDRQELDPPRAAGWPGPRPGRGPGRWLQPGQLPVEVGRAFVRVRHGLRLSARIGWGAPEPGFSARRRGPRTARSARVRRRARHLSAGCA